MCGYHELELEMTRFPEKTKKALYAKLIYYGSLNSLIKGGPHRCGRSDEIRLKSSGVLL